jgi:hypothetical protein
MGMEADIRALDAGYYSRIKMRIGEMSEGYLIHDPLKVRTPLSMKKLGH